jgi:hypothetical protein
VTRSPCGWFTLFGTDRLLSLLLRRLLRVGAGWLLLRLSSCEWEVAWFRTKRKVSDEVALWRVHGWLFGTGRLLSLLLRRLLRVGCRLAAAVVELLRLGSWLVSDEAESQ